MIWVHVLITYSTGEVQKSTFGGIVGFLGSPPAAPVFMTLMGVSFYYTRSIEMLPVVKRGLYIIASGYVLNFFRGVLPVFMAERYFPSAAARIPAAVADYSDAFLEIDILQFAGLALIAMAILRRIDVNKYVLLLLAVVVAGASPMLWGVSVHNPLANHFLDLFWGHKPSTEACIGNLVSFPFFPWFTYPLVGMFFGDMMTKSNNLSKTFRYIGVTGLTCLIAGGFIVSSNFSYHINDYYHARPGFTLLSVGIVLSWLYVCRLLVEKIKPNPVFEVLFEWSKNTTSIYMIQWVLIMVGADLLLGFYQCSYAMTLFVMGVMTAVTHLINRLYVNYRDA
jgi:uncharacterized membrane protein